MITKLQIQKAYYLLDKCKLSLGELQNRTVVERLVKKGRKPSDDIDRRPIVRTIRRIKGTGIPASTLKRFQEREIKLGRTSARKLSSMYDRLMFQRLRGAGANYKEARRLKSNSPDKIKVIISKYTRAATKIQHNYEQLYYDRLKAFQKQERDKAKPPKPSKPLKPDKPSKPSKLPERPGDDDSFERQVLLSQYEGDAEDTYLDEQDEQDAEGTYTPEYAPEAPVQPLTEPPLNDYPSVDEVIFGMGESEHLYSEWDDIADTSGVSKK